MLPIFPLRGAILLPRATLALNVFEPRYLVLVDYALAGDRLIGIVQATMNRRPARASHCAGWDASGGSPPSARVTTAA